MRAAVVSSVYSEEGFLQRSAVPPSPPRKSVAGENYKINASVPDLDGVADRARLVNRDQSRMACFYKSEILFASKLFIWIVTSTNKNNNLNTALASSALCISVIQETLPSQRLLVLPTRNNSFRYCSLQLLHITSVQSRMFECTKICRTMFYGKRSLVSVSCHVHTSNTMSSEANESFRT